MLFIEILFQEVPPIPIEENNREIEEGRVEYISDWDLRLTLKWLIILSPCSEDSNLKISFVFHLDSIVDNYLLFL